METQSFTALELYCLAYLCGKTKMFGLPDVFSAIPDEEKQSVLRQTIDALAIKNALEMDFDGNHTVTGAVREIVNAYCDCEKCLTVNSTAIDGSSDSIIAWSSGEKLYCATISEDRYWISETDEGTIKLLTSKEQFTQTIVKGIPNSTILNTALQKAKRFAMSGNSEEALRILLQNGASETAAPLILNSLLETNNYYCIALFTSEADLDIEKAWIGNADTILELREETVNYRPCTLFSEVSLNNVREEINGVIAKFLELEMLYE